jgi:hypothetical protein
MKWLIITIFLVAMIASRNWYEATTSERRTAYGLLALAAFALVLALGSIIA